MLSDRGLQTLYKLIVLLELLSGVLSGCQWQWLWQLC